MLATDADCVMYSPLLPDDQVVMKILRSGKNVVTPVGWVYPDRDNPSVRAIEEAALAGGVTLHGSGIHPGGITERFPLMISSLSSAITHAGRGVLRYPHLQRAAGGARGDGLRPDPEQAMSGPIAALLEAGFKQSVRMVADQLGFRAEPRIRSTQEVASPSAAPTNWWCRWKPARWPPAGSAGRRSWTTSRWSPRRSTG